MPSYRTDKIFEDDERINLRPATVEAIVKKLESDDLSETSEDVKGIAFEGLLCHRSLDREADKLLF
jgi:type I restriction enzyme M protein